MTTHPIIDNYFGAMRAKDIDALLALFAEDGVMALPDGKEFSGHDAIRAMYTHLFTMAAPSPQPQRSVVNDDLVAVEIEARMPDGPSRYTANFFHLAADGRIKRLSIYKRG